MTNEKDKQKPASNVLKRLINLPEHDVTLAFRKQTKSSDAQHETYDRFPFIDKNKFHDLSDNVLNLSINTLQEKAKEMEDKISIEIIAEAINRLSKKVEKLEQRLQDKEN